MAREFALRMASRFAKEYLEDWVSTDYDAKRLRRSLLLRGYDGIVIAKSETDFPEHGVRVDLVPFRLHSVKPVTVHKLLLTSRRPT